MGLKLADAVFLENVLWAHTAGSGVGWAEGHRYKPVPQWERGVLPDAHPREEVPLSNRVQDPKWFSSVLKFEISN